MNLAFSSTPHTETKANLMGDLSSSDPVGYNEIVRLRTESSAFQQEVRTLAGENAAVRADLEETRRQLLIVVAQRDALHTTLREAKTAPRTAARTIQDDVQAESLQKEIALYKQELANAENHRSVLSGEVQKLTTDASAMERAVEDALQAQGIAPPASAGASVLEKQHLLISAHEASRQRASELEAELSQTQQHVAFLADKDSEQEVLLTGYHALQRKITEEEGYLKRPEGEGKVAQLQRQLKELREQNVKLLEAQVEGGGEVKVASTANSGAVLTALQLEITRLHAKLQGKKETISKLRNVLKQYANAGVTPTEPRSSHAGRSIATDAAPTPLPAHHSNTTGAHVSILDHISPHTKLSTATPHSLHSMSSHATRNPPALTSPFAESRVQSPTRLKKW